MLCRKAAGVSGLLCYRGNARHGSKTCGGTVRVQHKMHDTVSGISMISYTSFLGLVL
jgi:hypothetical protein